MVVSSSIIEFLNTESLKTIKNFENIEKLSLLKLHYIKQFSYQYLNFKLLELFFNIQQFITPIKNKRNEIERELNILIKKYKDKHEHYIELSFEPHKRYFRKLNGKILTDLLLEKYEKSKSTVLKEFLEKRFLSKPFSRLTNNEIDEFISNKFFGNSNKIDLIEKSFTLKISPVITTKCNKNSLNILALFRQNCKFKKTKVEILNYFEEILVKKFKNEYHILDLPQYIENLITKDCKLIKSKSYYINDKELNECEKLILFLTNEFIVEIIPKTLIEYENIHFLKFYIKFDNINYYKIFEKDSPIYELFENKNNKKLNKEKQLIEFIIEHNYKLFNFLYPNELKDITEFKLKNIEQTKNLVLSNIVMNIMNNNILIEPVISLIRNQKKDYTTLDIRNFKILIINENKEIVKYLKVDNDLLKNFTYDLKNLEDTIYKFFKERTSLNIEKEIKLLNQFLYRIS